MSRPRKLGINNERMSHIHNILLIVICAVAAMAKIIAWTIIGVICLLVIVGLVKLVIKILF